MNDNLGRLIQSIRGKKKTDDEQDKFDESMRQPLRQPTRSEELIKQKVEEMRKKKKQTPGYE